MSQLNAASGGNPLAKLSLSFNQCAEAVLSILHSTAAETYRVIHPHAPDASFRPIMVLTVFCAGTYTPAIRRRQFAGELRINSEESA